MIAHGLPIYVALDPVDMRYGHERLGGMVREMMQTEPRSRALFVFVGKRKNIMKVLTLQRELNAAVAAAQQDGAPDDAGNKPKPKPKGRRDLSVSDLPKVLVEIKDEELEKTGKRIGFEESRELMFRRGGWSVLVKRVAKYAVEGQYGSSVVGVPTPPQLFRRGLLHTSAVAHLITQKFSLGVPHYRLEQHLKDQSVELDRGTMCRYVEEAGGALGATIVQAMWNDALKNAAVISTDATGALIQPEKAPQKLKQACKKGHFFTAVVDADAVLFAYAERHTQVFVKGLFGGFKGYLQSDASNVYDILDRGPPKDTDDAVTLVGCWAHYLESVVIQRLSWIASLCCTVPPAGLQITTTMRRLLIAMRGTRGDPTSGAIGSLAFV